jgi:hypothetical protein
MKSKSLFELELLWDRFKRGRRQRRSYFNEKDYGFMTIREREQLVDILLKILAKWTIKSMKSRESL